jgi:ribosomal protein S26
MQDVRQYIQDKTHNHTNVHTDALFDTHHHFIMGVCQIEYLYNSLYGCVSCPVYTVVHLASFHYGCYKLLYRYSIWHTSIMKWRKMYDSIYRTRHTTMQTVIQILYLTHTHNEMMQDVIEYLYNSLYGCVSCPVYTVVHLASFHYGCVSDRASVWTFVWLCVLSCIYCRTSCKTHNHTNVHTDALSDTHP